MCIRDRVDPEIALLNLKQEGLTVASIARDVAGNMIRCLSKEIVARLVRMLFVPQTDTINDGTEPV